MNTPDRLPFFKALMLLAVTLKEDMPDARLEGYWIALRDLELANIEWAVRDLLGSVRFFPKPVEIRERCELASGHLPPEEAWALVASLEEEDSVVWTDEIAMAYGVAALVFPDRVGARMAFLSAYRREIADADEPRWWASLGTNMPARAAALSDAIARGRLASSQAQRMLPPQYWPEETRALPASAEIQQQIKGVVKQLADTSGGKL